MFKFYSILFLSILLTTVGIAQPQQDLIATQQDGSQVLTLTLTESLSLTDIAEDYNVSLGLLKLFNDYNEKTALSADTKVTIPLTETNYFRNTKVSSNNGVYYPLYYVPSVEESLLSVCKKFFVTEFNIMTWNKLKTTDISGLSKVQIGWYRYGQGNGTSSISNNYKGDGTSFNKQSTFKEDVKRDLNVATTKIKQTFKKATTSKSAAKPLAKDSVAKVKPNLNLIEKKQLKSDFNEAVSRTKSSIKTVAEKLQSKTSKKPVSTEVTRKVEVPKTAIKTGEVIPEESPTPPQGIYQLAGSDTIININTELEATNELEPIKEIVKSETTTNGKAGWFYSGSLGNEFYAFTNSAKKGDYVLVESSNNPQLKVKAKVLGGLNDDEVSSGIIVLISDNAKEVFKAGNNQIDVKLSVQ